ncbi:porin [Polynucleobacter sp. MWH-UH2A]|uniref:porin n=1 Tax=Polynucleobacter sp. MWH-UH2A TaxID=1855617 RepID=UPI001BFE9D32|nr:porin [Polynucleobacter sp. MWH-UH2A]QWD64176.1 porin [Polynucleobacter sp. MWH-UH2A]
MKKSLFAVAALSALAGAAQAQSSVTVYGILDVGYIGTNQRVPSTTTTAGANTAAYKQTTNTLGQSAESTSRLGFKGNEDLGGGTSAFFTAEFQLYPNDANLEGSSGALNTGTSSNPYGGLINRQSFVGLKKNGIGSVSIGTQYTPVYLAGAGVTAGQYANMVGSVIYAGNGSGTTSSGFTVRANNSIFAESDTFAGFKVNGMYQANNNNRTETLAPYTNSNASTGGVTNVSGWGLGANYTWQKLYVAAGYQSFSNQTSASTNGIGALPSGATAATNGLNLTDNQGLVGATYDFGILKAYLGWTTRTATSKVDSSYYAKRSGQEIGVRSYITPVIESWASVGNGRFQGYGQSIPTANFVAWQIGTNYYLSKRTNLYGIFGTNNSSNTSTSAIFPNGAASGINQYAVGVRHTF